MESNENESCESEMESNPAKIIHCEEGFDDIEFSDWIWLWTEEKDILYEAPCINKGALIKPSARRSIHNYECSPADRQDMGRFGLKTKNNRDTGSSLDQGTDEVDNISEFPPPTDPLIIQRRNSHNSSSTLYAEEGKDHNIDFSNDKVLSKSLPPNFPSYSYYRDISLTRAQNRSNSSIRSQATQNYTQNNESSNNESSTSFHHEPDLSQLHEIEQFLAKYKKEKVQKKSNFLLILSMLAVAIGIIYSLYRNVSTASTVTNIINYDKNDFYKDMNDLRERYRITDDSVLRVKSGISSIFERSDTSSFIFVYDSQSNNFNPNEFNMFMDEVSLTAAKYLRNDTTSVSFIVLEGSKLDMGSHGELVSKYRDEVTKTGLMLVKDMDMVPSALAMAFHYYCDEYDPLARKSAIFFTLNLAKCSNNSVQKSAHHNIEKCLAKKWNDIPQDNIGPLLTRVVNIVVDVTSVF